MTERENLEKKLTLLDFMIKEYDRKIQSFQSAKTSLLRSKKETEKELKKLRK